MNAQVHRRRTCWLVASALAATLLLGWTSTVAVQDVGDEEGVRARSYEVRYRPLSEAVDLVGSLLSDAGTFSIQPRHQRLVVRDLTSVLDRVGEALEAYDLPPRNVEVTVALLLGSDRRAREAGRHVPSKSITREMRGVVETLGDFTKWTEYEQLGRRSVACMEGSRARAELSDEYRVSFRVETVEKKGGREIVTLDEIVVERLVKTPDGGVRSVRMPSTRILMRAGQQVMVGAARSPDAEQAVFLMIEAEPR